MSRFLIYKLKRLISWLRFLLFSSVIYFTLTYEICSTILGSVSIAFLLYLVSGGYKFMPILFRSLGRDSVALLRFIRLQIFIKKCTLFNLTLPKLFNRMLLKHPQKACFLFEDKTWSFQDVENFSNQIARFYLSKGYKQGDVVALVMESRPEYVCFWLGLSKIGCITALINTNLRLEPLKHCVEVSKARSMIIGYDLCKVLGDSLPLMNSLNLDFFSFGISKEDASSLNFPLQTVDEEIHMQLQSPPSMEQVFKCTDHVLYIYTSGTTGLPKSANISHLRFTFIPTGVSFMLNLQDDDILYDPLPLYHTAGGMVGVGQALVFGRTVAFRKKFSASKFWEDCIKYNATCAQYIGEICRYLLNQPIRPVDLSHKVAKMFGNGLRPQLWRQFVERFDIKQIGEFYGATEGNANIVNINNKEGSVGFLTRILPFLYPVTLIKINEDTGEPIRDEFGMCITCEPHEAGEFVGKISKSAARRFDGYSSEKDTAKKMVSGVFRKNDKCFRSGDLLIADELGYLYFKDRLGDTFRWRGENVSTSEVEGVISRIVGNKDCVVFGVEIPGTEGRAGMAAIVDEKKEINVPALSAQICKSLPPYACPIFIRILDEVDSTGTFKLKKTNLKSEGYALNGRKNTLFFLNGKVYEPFTESLHDQLTTGKIRV